MGHVSDKRVHTRYVVDVAVEVESPDGKVVSGRSRNISRGGLCLDVDDVVDSGDDVDVRIALIFHDQHVSEPLGLPARVVWCTPLGKLHQVGCKFAALAPEEAAYLDLFLSYIDAAPTPGAPDSHDTD